MKDDYSELLFSLFSSMVNLFPNAGIAIGEAACIAVFEYVELNGVLRYLP